MKKKKNELDEKLNRMPKPNLNANKKESIHQSLMDFENKFDRKKRRGFMMKRLVAGIGGVAAVALLGFLIITSFNEEPLDIADDQPQPDENQTDISNDEPERDDVDETEENVAENNDEDIDEPREDPDEQTINPIVKYDVLSDYRLDHPGYLSEERTFYESENTEYLLAYGHDAHAVNAFELFEMKEEEVTIIRFIVDDNDFERIESILHLDNWEEAMIEYLLDEVEPKEEIFFSFDQQQSETEITIDDQIYTVYPVIVDVGKTNYFKEGHGLWMKLYEDEMTVEFYGEKQKATRIIEEE